MVRGLSSFAALALLFGGLPGPAALHASEASAPDVTVRQNSGLYEVQASFDVREPAASVMATLTDYPRIPEFMPGVVRSVVLEAHDGHARVEQDAVSRLMIFSRSVHLVLDISETPTTLVFRDVSGDSFRRYEGSWTLAACPLGTRVLYHLTAQPAFDVPAMMLSRLLKRDSGRMIDGLRQAITARDRTGR